MSSSVATATGSSWLMILIEEERTPWLLPHRHMADTVCPIEQIQQQPVLSAPSAMVMQVLHMSNVDELVASTRMRHIEQACCRSRHLVLIEDGITGKWPWVRPRSLDSIEDHYIELKPLDSMDGSNVHPIEQTDPTQLFADDIDLGAIRGDHANTDVAILHDLAD